MTDADQSTQTTQTNGHEPNHAAPSASSVATRSAAGAALNSLPTSRRELLEVIKKAGEADIDLLSRRLGITASGARQHLTALERDGLVSHRQERTGPGRPRHLFALTPAADALFPRNYVDLTNELLEYVEEADPALLAEIFAKRGRRRLERAQARLIGRPFPEQVAEIARILDEDGYLADFVANDDGSYLLREHNCAVLGVALRYGHACSSELDFLQDALPGAVVTRVAHRVAGGHICAYEVRPKG